MISRRHALTGALATLVAGPAFAAPEVTWTAVTWQGREYMQGHYAPLVGKEYWGACLTSDFPEQRADMEATLRDLSEGRYA